MPAVKVRIVNENPNSSNGYDTLVEADAENTHIEVESEFSEEMRIWNFYDFSFIVHFR